MALIKPSGAAAQNARCAYAAASFVLSKTVVKNHTSNRKLAAMIATSDVPTPIRTQKSRSFFAVCSSLWSVMTTSGRANVIVRNSQSRENATCHAASDKTGCGALLKNVLTSGETTSATNVVMLSGA